MRLQCLFAVEFFCIRVSLIFHGAIFSLCYCTSPCVVPPNLPCVLIMVQVQISEPSFANPNFSSFSYRVIPQHESKHACLSSPALTSLLASAVSHANFPRLPLYSCRPRCRCSQCRMLMLVCDTCRARCDRKSTRSNVDDTTTTNNNNNTNEDNNNEDHNEDEVSALRCELCASSQRAQAPTKAQRTAELARRLRPPAARLRLLCLHGFRSSGEKLRGRTNGLRRRLKVLCRNCEPSRVSAWPWWALMFAKR